MQRWTGLPPAEGIGRTVRKRERDLEGYQGSYAEFRRHIFNGRRADWSGDEVSALGLGQDCVKRPF